MKGFKLPIMIGCYEKADKTTVIAKDLKFGGYSLFICRLKQPEEIGAETPKENIGKVLVHLHFCKFENARVFAKAANRLVELWEGEGNEDGYNSILDGSED